MEGNPVDMSRFFPAPPEEVAGKGPEGGTRSAFRPSSQAGFCYRRMRVMSFEMTNTNRASNTAIPISCALSITFSLTFRRVIIS